jgi:hypothetical protein
MSIIIYGQLFTHLIEKEDFITNLLWSVSILYLKLAKDSQEITKCIITIMHQRN